MGSASKRFQQQQKHKQQQQQQQQQLKQQQQFEASQPLRDDHKLCNNPLSHCSNFFVSCWLILQLLHPFLTTEVSSLLFITSRTSTTNTVGSPPLALCSGQGFSSVCSYLVPRGNLAQRLC